MKWSPTTSACIQKVLAVVEHEKQPEIPDVADDAVHRRTAGLIGEPEGARHRDRQQIQVGDRRQVDVSDVVGMIARD
jgi:hypothetical protein